MIEQTEDFVKGRRWDQIALLNETRYTILSILSERKIATIEQLRQLLFKMGFYGAAKRDRETGQLMSKPMLSWHTVRSHVLLLADEGLLKKNSFPLIKASYQTISVDAWKMAGSRGKIPGRALAVGYELSAEGERYFNSLRKVKQE